MEENQTGGFGGFALDLLGRFGEFKLAETQAELELARINELNQNLPEKTIDQTAASVVPDFGLGGPENAMKRANLFTSVVFVGGGLAAGYLTWKILTRRR